MIRPAWQVRQSIIRCVHGRRLRPEGRNLPEVETLMKPLYIAAGIVLLGMARADDAQVFAQHSVFPKDNAWNADISQAPVDPNSAAYIAKIGASNPLHPDFGVGHNGIPYQFVDAHTPRVPVAFTYADESDKGP